MTQTRFNIIQIVLIVLVLLGTILVAKIFWKILKKRLKKIAVTSVVILSLLGVGTSVFLGLGIVERERSIVATVESVSDSALPVFFGASRAYTIYIEEDTDPVWGEIVHSFTTDGFSSKELQKIASEVKPGDRVLLKYNRWHDLYYCEILN